MPESLEAIKSVTMLAVVLLAVTVHEVAHGYAALKLGDDTAYHAGRLTLNPIAHLDIFGSILLPLLLYIGTKGAFTFAWAKPVPVNPIRFRRNVTMRGGMSLVAAAGPLSNFALAILFALVFRVIFGVGHPMMSTLGMVAALAVMINLSLAFFNLVPIPPLDGSKVLLHFLSPNAAGRLLSLEPYGFVIILLLLNLTPFGDVLGQLTGIAMAFLLGLV